MTTALPSDDARCFAINAPAAACQIIDGEAIVIHFDRGNYFSAKASGALALDLLERGFSMGDVASAFARHYQLDIHRATAVVQRFVAELLAEDLIVAAEARDIEGTDPASLDAGDVSSFEEPALVKYTDLQDVLVLDPLHDVVVPGWPGPRS